MQHFAPHSLIKYFTTCIDRKYTFILSLLTSSLNDKFSVSLLLNTLTSPSSCLLNKRKPFLPPLSSTKYPNTMFAVSSPLSLMAFRYSLTSMIFNDLLFDWILTARPCRRHHLPFREARVGSIPRTKWTKAEHMQIQAGCFEARHSLQGASREALCRSL